MIGALLARFRRVPGIYHVSDNADWVLQWVAKYVSDEVTRRGSVSQVVASPWHLRGQLIHFHDRYLLLQNKPGQLHRSNRVFLTWLHGDPLQPEFAEAGRLLLEHLPRIEKIVTSCTTTEQQLLRAGIPAEKLRLIPLGVDTQLFVQPPTGKREAMRGELNIPLDAFCIGSFQKDGSGWGDGEDPKLIKGPDVFLATIAHLVKRHANIFVVLTGPSRGYVKRGLEKLGVPYVHHFLKHYPDVLNYYYALDAYLITSRAEGGPIGLMESWSTGVPVVSTFMGMPADLIRQGENGFLADVGDAVGLAAQMEPIIQDKTVRERLIQQGMQDVKALDWRILAGQYYELLYEPFL